MLNQKSLERWAHENSARYCMAPAGSSIPLPDNWPGAVVKDTECSDPTAAIKKLKQGAQKAHSRLGIYGDTKREQADGARLEAEVAAGVVPGLEYLPLCTHTLPSGKCLGHADPKEVNYKLRLSREIKAAFSQLGDETKAWPLEQVMDWLNKTRTEIIERGLKE
jgi:hypothetical protein